MSCVEKNETLFSLSCQLKTYLQQQDHGWIGCQLASAAVKIVDGVCLQHALVSGCQLQMIPHVSYPEKPRTAVFFFLLLLNKHSIMLMNELICHLNK